jgi:acetyltransferase-like isoleucine patch superfamily enzyme
MGIENFILKIRKRESKFYSKLKDTLQTIVFLDVPAPEWVFRPLYEAVIIFRFLTHIILEKLFYVPVFKSRCESCGKRLSLPNGIPWIEGNLSIRIGNEVSIDDNIFVSGRVVEKPALIIGDRSVLGFKLTVSVGKRVEIGNDVMIAGECIIADNDGHPLSPLRRLRKEPVAESEIEPVKIEDNVWIGTRAIILKGVTVGVGSVIAANSLVTRTVPPNCVVMGVPAKVVRTLTDKNSEEKSSETEDGEKVVLSSSNELDS